MSTSFNGASSYIEVAGAAYGRLAKLGAVFHGGQALAVLWRPDGVGAMGLFHDHNQVASVNPYSDAKMYYSARLFVFTDTGSAPTPRLYSASDGWRLDVFTTRDNGAGAVVVRLHAYNYTAGTWTHDDLGTTVGMGNDAFQSPGTIGAFNEAGSGQSLSGSIAAVAVWGFGGDRLTDAQIETMTAKLGDWVDLDPAPSVVWSLEDATSLPLDVLGVGVEATTLHLVGHDTDEPAGWSYGLNSKSGLYAAFTQFVNSAGNTSETLTTDTFDVAAGDVLVAKVTTSDTATHVTVSDSSSLTWTKQAEIAPGGFNGYAAVYTAVATGSASIAVSAVPDASTYHTMTVERWVGGQLAGTPATGTGNGSSSAPSVNITTTADNAVVTWVSYDNNSQNPLGRAYRLSAVEDGINDGHYGTNTVHYSAHAKVGAAGTYAMGQTAPGSQIWVLAGVEIQPVAGGGGVDAGAASRFLPFLRAFG